MRSVKEETWIKTLPWLWRFLIFFALVAVVKGSGPGVIALCGDQHQHDSHWDRGCQPTSVSSSRRASNRCAGLWFAARIT